MNEKERLVFAELHSKLLSEHFDEIDVLGLLTILRNYVRNGPVRELALHATHSDRDSGAIFQRVRDNKKALDRLGRKPGKITSGDVFSARDFERSLADAFRAFKAEPPCQRVTELVLLSAMSLMQGGRMIRSGQTAALGTLSLWLTQAAFELSCSITIKHKGQDISAEFVVLTVPNRVLPICNPRARVPSQNVVRVRVNDSRPIIDGFPPFEVHFEREPPITAAELDALVVSDPRLTRTNDQNFTFKPDSGSPLLLRYDGHRISAPGSPEHFVLGSASATWMKALSRRLGACVHDDANAHWFVEPVAALGGIPPDGFHCHWIGRAGPTCTRPL